MKPVQIKTLEDLAAACALKRAVTHSTYIVGGKPLQSLPMPAVFVLNMPASIVLRRLRAGLFLYTPPVKIKPKQFRNQTTV